MLRIGLNSLKKEDYPNPKTHEKVFSFFAFFSSTAFGRGKLLLMDFSNYNGKPPLKIRKVKVTQLVEQAPVPRIV